MRGKNYIYRHARPLDLARWQYHFEDGSREAVWTALTAYQNADGGFGYGLEADCWNSASSPIQTWCATEILREVGVTDASHPIVQGILRYLASGADFDQQHRQWYNTVPGNNDHPHAVWWGWNGDDEFCYNPTACLAGFAVKYAQPDSGLYQLACQLCMEAVAWLEECCPQCDGHVTACFLRMEEYLTGTDVVDLEKLHRLLHRQIQHHCDVDREKWGKEYVFLPTQFVEKSDGVYAPCFAQEIAVSLQVLKNTRQEDGTWPVLWTWWTEYPEWHVAKEWWTADILIKNSLTLRAFATDEDF